MDKKKGNVYWITGLSGAGKTTIGVLLHNHLLKRKDNVVRLDGDELRTIFRNNDYTFDGRKSLAYQYCALCKLLSDQGIDVIICTISMYDEVRSWNRKNIKNYKEIYLEVSIEELIRRDQKGLYSKALGNDVIVTGLNVEAQLPQKPDILIKNYDETTPEQAVKLIINGFEL